MTVKCVNLLSVVLVLFFFVRRSHQENYALNTPRGVAARIDILNALKIALRLAHATPKSKEYKAAVLFTKFIASGDSDDYLEAFYAIPTDGTVNKFHSFLNGFIYNGDPGLPGWAAANALAQMIRTKVNSHDLEALREKLKHAKSRGLAISSFKGKKRHLDYLDILHSPQLVYMGPYMGALKSKYQRRKFLQEFAPGNVPLLLQLMLENSYGDNSNTGRRDDVCSCSRSHRRSVLQQTHNFPPNAFDVMYNTNEDDDNDNDDVINSLLFNNHYPGFMLDYTPLTNPLL